MEKVVTVATTIKSKSKEIIKSAYKSLEELSNLVNTANGIVVNTFLVKREKIDPAYYIGKGKAIEIGNYVEKFNIRTVVFDNELSPAQIKNLEQVINAKIIDRTRLILDIFAQRAHSKEAQLQVELAQLQYMLPRLTQKGIYMDNQVGGIGTRGPGETKLEYDRRKIMQRIQKIKQELQKVVISRQEQKKLRSETGLPVIALIGYTNSGKSTLFNSLLKSNEAYADNKLFATLDPLTRQLILPDSMKILIVDTVGFIDKLPHHLIESFKSTLEVVKDASILLEVIDLTSEDIEKKEKLVQQILTELSADNIPIIKVYNKIDLLTPKLYRFYKNKFGKYKNSVFISAKTSAGVDKLIEKIQLLLKQELVTKILTIKPENYQVLNFIYKYCKVVSNNIYNNLLKIKIVSTKNVYKQLLTLLQQQ